MPGHQSPFRTYAEGVGESAQYLRMISARKRPTAGGDSPLRLFLEGSRTLHRAGNIPAAPAEYQATVEFAPGPANIAVAGISRQLRTGTPKSGCTTHTHILLAFRVICHEKDVVIIHHTSAQGAFGSPSLRRTGGHSLWLLRLLYSSGNRL